MGKKDDDLTFDIQQTKALVGMLAMLGIGVWAGWDMGKTKGAREAYAERRAEDADANMARRLRAIEQKLDIQPEVPYGYGPTAANPIPVRIVVEEE